MHNNCISDMMAQGETSKSTMMIKRITLTLKFNSTFSSKMCPAVVVTWPYSYAVIIIDEGYFYYIINDLGSVFLKNKQCS